MLSLSAKTVNLSALPSPSVSSQILMRSLPLPRRLLLVGVVDASRRPTAGRARPRPWRWPSRCPAPPRTARRGSRRQLHVLQRLCRRQRRLHLLQRLGLHAPLVARRVERDRRRAPARTPAAAGPSATPRGSSTRAWPPSGCRSRAGGGSPSRPRCARRGRARCRTRGPLPTSRVQVYGSGFAPSVRGTMRTLRSVVVHVVDVRLVPARELVEAEHGRVVGVGDLRLEDLAAVALELGADELDVLRRVVEAVRRAVDGHEAAAVVDVVEQGLLLLGRDRLDVGEDQQAVDAGEGAAG